MNERSEWSLARIELNGMSDKETSKVDVDPRSFESKMPPKWGFSPICDPPRFFFKNRALSLLYPYGALTSCKKLEKTNEQSLKYLKTDGLTDRPTDKGDY